MVLVSQVLRQVAILRQVVSQTLLRPAVSQVLRDLLRRKPPHHKTHLPAHLRARLKAHPPTHLLCPLSSSRLRLLRLLRRLSSGSPRRLSHLLAHLLSFRLYLLLLSSSTKLSHGEKILCL